MPVKLTTVAIEESTYVINFSFEDEDGNAVAPATLVWSLTDYAGTVINSQDQTAVSSPTSSEDIVLSGDDLAIQSGEEGRKTVDRKVTIEATYDSNAGSGLPLKEVATFRLRNLTKIS